MQTLPKPSKVFLVVSLLVVLVCLGLISILMAAMALVEEPTVRVLGGLLLIFPVLLAVEQYRAAFQRDSGAAAVSAGLLIFLTSLAPFLSLFLLVMAGQAEYYGSPFAATLFISALVLFFWLGPLGLVSGWMNYRWDQALPPGDGSGPWMQFTLRELFGLVTATALCSAMTATIIHAFTPDYTEHVGRSDAPVRLPVDATDVCFRASSGDAIVLECTTTEHEFRRWVASGIGPFEGRDAQTAIEPITDTVYLERYNTDALYHSGPKAVAVDQGFNYFQANEAQQAVWVVFDATTSRVYLYQTQ